MNSQSTALQSNPRKLIFTASILLGASVITVLLYVGSKNPLMCINYTILAAVTTAALSLVWRKTN